MWRSNTQCEGALVRGYRLVRPLGEGGMGTVWEAEHSYLGRRVALKVVASRHERRPELKARLLDEARFSAEVEHPNVVRVLDFQLTEEGDPLLVMELLDGCSLADEVERNGPLSVYHAQLLMMQMTAALEATHRHGIAHLDVKTDNIILVRGPSFLAKLIDFGISQSTRVLESTNQTSTTAGTPEFMSPEQLGGCDDVDVRSDDFGLAVCMYYALTGTMPFVGSVAAQLWLAISRGEIAPLTTLRKELRPALDAFFARALAYEKRERFATTTDLRAAFLTASNGPLEDAAKPAERLRLSRRPAPRSGWFVAALCTVSVAGGAALVGGIEHPWLARAEDADEDPYAPSDVTLDADAAADAALGDASTLRGPSN